MFTAKQNQPTLHKAVAALLWHEIPTACQASETGHGRPVTRTVKAVEVPAWISFPGARQVLQARRTVTKKGKRTVEVAYLICSNP